MEDSDAYFFPSLSSQNEEVSLHGLLFPLKKMLRHAARRLAASSAAAASSSLSIAAALATEAVGARGLAVATTMPAQSSATSMFSCCRRGFASESDGERGFRRLFEHF